MPKTLLLADDSVTIQKVVGISLANEDIHLVTVENGDDAVTKAQEVRPDIVLADIVMPGKNGYEVCETLKADPALAKTPVLLLTGTFEAFDAERARQAGADGHITKPFEAQALVDQVNQLLARSASLGDGSAAAVAPPRPEPQAAPAGGEGGGAFDFFDGGGESGETSWPTAVSPAEASGANEGSGFGEMDFMDDSMPSGPAEADETVLLDATRPSDDPAFDAAVEAAAFDAPGERTPLRESDDSGFDLESADLSMASTVPEVSMDSGAMSFSDPGPQPAPEPEATADPLLDFDPGAETSPVGGAAEETVLDPAGVQSFDVPASETADAEDATEAVIEHADPVRVQSPADAENTAPVSVETAAAPELPPALQQHLHATLEKIAWEAFSDLSEQVVKQVVSRVEAVAWEVIPQMTEVLIREEIARMKGDGEESEGD